MNPIIPILILICVIAIGYFIFNQYNLAHSEGSSCTPSSGDTVTGGSAYEYDTKGGCAPSGYVVDTSDGTCVSNKCKPEPVDPHASDSATYEYDSDDDCAPTGCQPKYKVTGGTCQKSTTGASV